MHFCLPFKETSHFQPKSKSIQATETSTFLPGVISSHDLLAISGPIATDT